MYGWGYFYKKLLDTRLEVSCNKFNLSDNFKWFIFIEVLNNMFYNNYNIKNQFESHIMYLDFINCYRGYRYLKRLPVRGQRTWTNAWNSYKCNTLINEWKIQSSKKIYGNLNNNILNMLYMSEHINYLWKIQWKKEWLEARSKKFKLMKKTHAIFYIDIISMSKGYLSGYTKKNYYQKKKKINQKKIISH